jgi:hypothetical protein
MAWICWSTIAIEGRFEFATLRRCVGLKVTLMA